MKAYLWLANDISKPIIQKMGEVYNPFQPTTWILYIDATNLYGLTMSQYLPIGNYEWEASWEYLLKNPAMKKKYLDMILKTKADALRGSYVCFPFSFKDS